MKRFLISLGLVTTVAALSSCAADEPLREGDTIGGDEGSTGVAEQTFAGEPLGAPDDVYIVKISGNGPGCLAGTPGTLTYDLAPDRKTFVIYLNDMQLQHPIGPTYQRTNCTAGITVHVPNGWQFSVATINTRGFAHLPIGSWGRQISSYFFAGSPLGSAARSRLEGPYDDIYSFTDYVKFDSFVWSACGRDSIFTVNTALELDTANNDVDSAYISNDTIDGTFQKILHWQWRPCTL